LAETGALKQGNDNENHDDKNGWCRFHFLSSFPSLEPPPALQAQEEAMASRILASQAGRA
jgi:hypothetical protein